MNRIKRSVLVFACALLLGGCVSPASVPEQTHPLATALPPATDPGPEPEATPADPILAPAPTPEPSEQAAALAAEYLAVLTGQDFSGLSYKAELLTYDALNGREDEWNISFTLPGQPVTANMRFEKDGALTFYALFTEGKTDETLQLPLDSMPGELQEADYKQIAAYWYEKLPFREDAPLKRVQLARKDNTLQYPHSAYVLNTIKLRFEDGSVLTCQYDQGTRRLVYFCHYTAEGLGR